MQPSRLATNTRLVVRGAEAQAAIKEAVELVRDVAAAAYGPSSGNVGVEAQYGDPIASHDGVFNLDHLHISDPAVNMAVRMLVQSSRSTNVRVGDGTTLAALMGACLYLYGIAQLASTRESRRSVARRIEAAARAAVEHIDKVKVEATPELLHAAAVISASDEAVGHLIADTVQEIGADGGVLIEDFSGSGIYNDIVSGFYFRRGFTNAALLTDPSNLESRFDKVFVLVCDKQLTNVGDIAPILDRCISANIRELVIVGDVQTEALAVAVKLRLEGKITTTIVDAPDFGALRTLFMDDLALYVGGKVLNGGANSNEFRTEMLGAAKVFVNEFSTTVLDGERDEKQEKALQKRIDELTEELRTAQSPIEQEAVRTRLGRLTGRIAILRVGGNTETEQKEVKLRVEDAVAALQAAIKDGVVPGGGTTLARLAPKLPFRDAFEEPIKLLLGNAGFNADRGLWQVQESKPWNGFDLRNEEFELVDLKKFGVVDPTLVLKEAVSNGASAAAQLIQMTVLMPFDNREAKRG